MNKDNKVLRQINREYTFEFHSKILTWLINFVNTNGLLLVTIVLIAISVYAFNTYYINGLGLAYNDARSHLDIGRRVVEGLKPGVAQLGSVWLPLPHVLMALTIWNDFMWHSGLAGAIVSMLAFIFTGRVIYKYLEELEVNLLGKVFGVFVFVANINILYLQSTAMTELLILATMTYASYELMLWYKDKSTLHLLKTAIWVMLSTLTRYDGWFLLAWSSMLVVIRSSDILSLKLKATLNKKVLFKELKVTLKYLKNKYSEIEGTYILYGSLAGLGVVLWLLWNLLIFKDPLYFALGPFSAKSQQDQLDVAGVLQTKHNLWLSIKFYTYALVYNSNAFIVILGAAGAIMLWLDKKVSKQIRLASTALIAPLLFNIVALFLGHSVLFIQGLSGDTWFNVRYGIMLMPSIAIFIGYLVTKLKSLKHMVIGLALLVIFFGFASQDAVTIDDARVGSSQKNVTEVSGWLNKNALDKPGFVLISAASHDAIIFSSGLPMKKFIHEGTGLYWDSATALPDRWARWIIMRTYDDNDLTYKNVKDSSGLEKYNLVGSFPFADIYEIKPEYIEQLNTTASLGKQK